MQAAAALLAIAWMAMAPPVTGEVLLLPLWHGARPVDAALDLDMRIVAAGPLDGVVARSDGGRDDRFLLRHGILVLAAPAFLCGGIK